MNTKNFKIFKQLLQRGLTPDRIRQMDFSDFNFMKVDFAGASFAGASFAGASFAGASFARASLDGARFDGARFTRARFTRASFAGARFDGAIFDGARFDGAIFDGARFDGARFDGAIFDGAIFDGARFTRASINESTFGLTINCPEEGAFVAWKKCAKNTLVKLLIPEDAKRSSATTFKCRASKAVVLDIAGDKMEIASSYDSSFIYRKGETVEVPDFDDNRWNECSAGIHFFMNKEMAKQYN